MSQLETDCFRLGRHAMFRTLRDHLPEDRGRAQNLVECKDDMLFAWNAAEGSVLCLNWRAAYTKEADTVAYQTLIPTTPQVFGIDKITASTEGSFLALSGSRGVAVMELPRRWGPNGQYQAGKERICCSTYNLDERFFINNSGLEVRQVRWHPASPKDSHLLVLLSNNTIRLYEEQSLRTVWRIGPVPTVSPGRSGGAATYLGALGDTAVDFDIAPPRAAAAATAAGDNNDTQQHVNSTTQNNISNASGNGSFASQHTIGNDRTAVSDRRPTPRLTRVEWPLIVLRGNGNLYVMLIGIDTEKPQIQGPLTITPAQADNYGLDYCSLLVLPSQPPTLVLAETNGNLHHAVLLEAEPDTGADASCNEVDASLRLAPAEWCVHMLEVVQLELGLAGAGGAAKQTSCAIFLKRDAINDTRYFAHHETGLHAITVAYIAQLARFADDDDAAANPDTDNLLGQPSHAEYVVCTQAIDSARCNAVLGFTLLHAPAGLLLFLGSGQVVSLNLIADSSTLRDLHAGTVAGRTNPARRQPDGSGNTRSDQPSFELHIKSLLTSPITQPLLQLATTTAPSSKEQLELLMHATHVLREQYFVKHDRVRQELEKRCKLLQLMRTQQQDDIAALQLQRDRVRSTAERLAERYEDIQEKQLAIFRRAQEVARLVTAANPQSAAAEAEFKQQIDRIGVQARRLAGSIEAARRRVGAQETQVQQFQGAQRQRAKAMVLQPRMEATIRGLMTELNADIEAQIKEVRNIKAHANIS